MSKETINEAISRQVFSDVLHSTFSKSDLRRRKIIEGAIEAFASINYDHLTYDDIAAPAKTSRRLAQHYFPDKKKLFEITMKVIRAQYQGLVIEAFSHIQDPKERFCEYIRAAVAWPDRLPSHVRAWFLYYLVCSQQPKLRKLHEDLAKIGEDRIVALIMEFQSSPAADLKFVAKTVQRLITGALIEMCSESTNPNLQKVQDEVVKASLGALLAL